MGFFVIWGRGGGGGHLQRPFCWRMPSKFHRKCSDHTHQNIHAQLIQMCWEKMCWDHTIGTTQICQDLQSNLLCTHPHNKQGLFHIKLHCFTFLFSNLFSVDVYVCVCVCGYQLLIIWTHLQKGVIVGIGEGVLLLGVAVRNCKIALGCLDGFFFPSLSNAYFLQDLKHASSVR